MGVKSSIHKSIGQGKIDFKLDWLHPLGRGISSADCLANEASSSPLSALVGSIFLRQNNIFRGDERLDILLEKGTNESWYRVNFRRPSSDGDRQQQSITFQNTLTPATSIHGIATDSFGSVHGGIRLQRLAIEIDKKWASDSKLTSMVGMRIECNLLLEQGLPISSNWLHFQRFKFHRRKRVKLGPTFGFSSISCGTVKGDLAPHSAFPIGGFNSVRGYGEGAVGTGKSYVVAASELYIPVTELLQGVIFADFGTDKGSGRRVHGDPAAARRKPGIGFGFGVGIRVDSSFGPLRIDYAINMLGGSCIHFGLGYHD